MGINLKEELQALVEAHGEQKVAESVALLLAKSSAQVPADHIAIIGADKLRATISQLDMAVSDVLACVKTNEEAYIDRGDMLRRRTQIETDVKLTEADAIMAIRGESRSQYVEIGGERVALSNDTARDAYRRLSSKNERMTLAEVNGLIAISDTNIAKNKDQWTITKTAVDMLRAKAELQAALLNFLS